MRNYEHNPQEKGKLILIYQYFESVEIYIQMVMPLSFFFVITIVKAAV